MTNAVVGEVGVVVEEVVEEVVEKEEEEIEVLSARRRPSVVT
jgi:hypothetical protein